VVVLQRSNAYGPRAAEIHLGLEHAQSIDKSSKSPFLSNNFLSHAVKI